MRESRKYLSEYGGRRATLMLSSCEEYMWLTNLGLGGRLAYGRKDRHCMRDRSSWVVKQHRLMAVKQAGRGDHHPPSPSPSPPPLPRRAAYRSR